MRTFIKFLPKIPAFIRGVIAVANTALEICHVVVTAFRGIRSVFAASAA